MNRDAAADEPVDGNVGGDDPPERDAVSGRPSVGTATARGAAHFKPAGGDRAERAPVTTDSEQGEIADADPDTQLFREAVRDVKPLSAEAPVVSDRRRHPQPVARFSRADRHAVLEESLNWLPGDPELASGDELVYHRAGVQTSVLKKLRRGQYRVQAEIDLHGLTVAEAKQALRDFLATALDRQYRCVRIIHGKGLRSGHRGPVLKGVVSSVLRRVKPVVAYVSARQVDGGTGAVYVLLAN
jgi:DNA-nicking Smr family endonuclease